MQNYAYVLTFIYQLVTNINNTLFNDIFLAINKIQSYFYVQLHLITDICCRNQIFIDLICPALFLTNS